MDTQVQTALVFDSKLWNYKDVGDNSRFWKEADILETYLEDDWQDRPKHVERKLLANVRFHHDGRISNGHFTHAMNHHQGL